MLYFAVRVGQLSPFCAESIDYRWMPTLSTRSDDLYQLLELTGWIYNLQNKIVQAAIGLFVVLTCYSHCHSSWLTQFLPIPTVLSH